HPDHAQFLVHRPLDVDAGLELQPEIVDGLLRYSLPRTQYRDPWGIRRHHLRTNAPGALLERDFDVIAQERLPRRHDEFRYRRDLIRTALQPLLEDARRRVDVDRAVF